jgi:hypothetical protein
MSCPEGIEMSEVTDAGRSSCGWYAEEISKKPNRQVPNPKNSGRPINHANSPIAQKYMISIAIK